MNQLKPIKSSYGVTIDHVSTSALAISVALLSLGNPLLAKLLFHLAPIAGPKLLKAIREYIGELKTLPEKSEVVTAILSQADYSENAEFNDIRVFDMAATLPVSKLLLGKTASVEATSANTFNVSITTIDSFDKMPSKSDGPVFIFPGSLKSKALRDTIERVNPWVRSPLPIVLLGPSGCGKDVFARYIHNNSNVTGKYVAVNCSSLNDLSHSQLFGHKKGSFNDATEDRAGLVEVANGGTLFLDELGKIPHKAQDQLLRFLAGDGEFNRLGETTGAPRHSTVRLITAMSQDIHRLLDEGILHKDFHNRIKTIIINMPSLDQQPENVYPAFQLMANDYMRTNFAYVEQGSNFIKGRLTIKEDVVAHLMNYSWPGNYRDLRDCAAKSVVLSQHNAWVIDKRIVSAAMIDHQSHWSPMDDSPESEQSRITRALTASHGNVKRAAEHLKMNRTTLNDRIHFHGIDLKYYRGS